MGDSEKMRVHWAGCWEHSGGQKYLFARVAQSPVMKIPVTGITRAHIY